MCDPPLVRATFFRNTHVLLCRSDYCTTTCKVETPLVVLSRVPQLQHLPVQHFAREACKLSATLCYLSAALSDITQRMRVGTSSIYPVGHFSLRRVCFLSFIRLSKMPTRTCVALLLSTLALAGCGVSHNLVRAYRYNSWPGCRLSHALRILSAPLGSMAHSSPLCASR